VEHLLAEWRYTERHACRLVKQPRATQRYEARIDYEERRIRKRLHELAKKHPGSGYRRMTRLLRREGMKINKKRVQRLWREEGLGKNTSSSLYLSSRWTRLQRRDRKVKPMKYTSLL